MFEFSVKIYGSFADQRKRLSQLFGPLTRNSVGKQFLNNLSATDLKTGEINSFSKMRFS